MSDVPDELQTKLGGLIALVLGSAASVVPILRGPLAEVVTRVSHGIVEFPEPDDDAFDRVHAAMVPQESGHRRLISAEEDRGPGFLRLANAFSALYPHGSQGKRDVGRHIAGGTRMTCDV